MKKLSMVCLCVACHLCSARADFIGSPGVFGNSGTGLPFVPGTNGTPSVRFQQVFGASDFMKLGTPFLITQIDFGEVTGMGIQPVSAFDPVEIELSTTIRTPDGLSRVFSDNIGPDRTAVLSTLLDVHDDKQGSYGIHVSFQTPFLYDPRAGNLLLDVRVFRTVPYNPIPGPQLIRAQDALGDTVSSVWARDVNATTATGDSTLGLVALFTVTPVPEPATWALLLAGVGTLGLWRRARSMRKWENKT